MAVLDGWAMSLSGRSPRLAPKEEERFNAASALIQAGADPHLGPEGSPTPGRAREKASVAKSGGFSPASRTQGPASAEEPMRTRNRLCCRPALTGLRPRKHARGRHGRWSLRSGRGTRSAPCGIPRPLGTETARASDMSLGAYCIPRSPCAQLRFVPFTRKSAAHSSQITRTNFLSGVRGTFVLFVLPFGFLNRLLETGSVQHSQLANPTYRSTTNKHESGEQQASNHPSYYSPSLRLHLSSSHRNPTFANDSLTMVSPRRHKIACRTGHRGSREPYLPHHHVAGALDNVAGRRPDSASGRRLLAGVLHNAAPPLHRLQAPSTRSLPVRGAPDRVNLITGYFL